MKEISFRQVNSDDDISQMINIFVNDEIMLKNCPITDKDRQMFQSEFDQKSVPQGLSVLAEMSNQVCGLLIVSHGSVDLQMKEFKEEEKSFNFKINQEFDNYTEFLMPDIVGSTNYLLLQVCCVDPSYRRIHIASSLVKKVEEVANIRKYEALILVATSENSINLFTKLGYTSEKQFFYSDYVYPENNQKVFSHINGKHKRAVIMMKRLS